MKANDLRLGNYVLKSLKSGNGRKIEVKIDLGDFIRICDGSELYNFEPILLTEEWLVRFGFEKKENGLFTKIFEYTYNSLKYIDEYKRWIYYNDDNDAGCNAIADLNYVHQLQNLYFALNDEELTMK